MKFRGEARVEFKTGEKQNLPKLITENKNTEPLLGQDRLDKLEIGLQEKKYNIIRNTNTDERSEKILNEYEDLFKINHTI